MASLAARPRGEPRRRGASRRFVSRPGPLSTTTDAFANHAIEGTARNQRPPGTIEPSAGVARRIRPILADDSGTESLPFTRRLQADGWQDGDVGCGVQPTPLPWRRKSRSLSSASKSTGLAPFSARPRMVVILPGTVPAVAKAADCSASNAAMPTGASRTSSRYAGATIASTLSTYRTALCRSGKSPRWTTPFRNFTMSCGNTSGAFPCTSR